MKELVKEIMLKFKADHGRVPISLTDLDISQLNEAQVEYAKEMILKLLIANKNLPLRILTPWNDSIFLDQIKNIVTSNKTNQRKVQKVYEFLTGNFGDLKMYRFNRKIDQFTKKQFNQRWYKVSDMKKEPSVFTKYLSSLQPNLTDIDRTWQPLINSAAFNSKAEIQYKRYITVVVDGTPDSVNEFHKIAQIYLVEVIKPIFDLRVPFSTKMVGKPFHLLNHLDTFVFHTPDRRVLQQTQKYFNNFYARVQKNIDAGNIKHLLVLRPTEREELYYRPTYGIDVRDCTSDTGSLASFIVTYCNFFQENRIPISNDIIKNALEMWIEMDLDSRAKFAKMCKDLDYLKSNPLPIRRNRYTKHRPSFSSWDLATRDGSEVQTIIFNDQFFNGNEARAWLRKHGFKTPQMDRTVNFLRYRQKDPKKFYTDSFRTLEFKDGILAVVAIPKR